MVPDDIVEALDAVVMTLEIEYGAAQTAGDKPASSAVGQQLAAARRARRLASHPLATAEMDGQQIVVHGSTEPWPETPGVVRAAPVNSSTTVRR